jgi:hydroxymethylbilane synthase
MGLDALILASAGLRRMCWEARVSEYFEPEVMLPAVGQGVLAIEGRMEDQRVRRVVAPLNHLPTQMAVLAERAFLKKLGGGCQVPLAGFARVVGDKLIMDGLVAGVDGRKVVKGRAEGPLEKNEELGCGLAEDLLRRGAEDILREVYTQG